MGDQIQVAPHHTGVLECPLRRGFIEFEFQTGDTVAELKRRIDEVWGAPKSGMEDDLRRHGHFWDAGSWAVFCETDRSSTFVLLHDKDRIPTTPPRASGNAGESLMDGAARNFGRAWKGLVHENDMYDGRELIVSFSSAAPSADEPAGRRIRLLALVAVTGG